MLCVIGDGSGEGEPMPDEGGGENGRGTDYHDTTPAGKTKRDGNMSRSHM